MQWIVIFFVIVHQCGYNYVKSHERVPPGISPQHYQQPYHQGPNIHQPPQHQVPQYQVPQQQIPQQQIPQQQIPQQQIPQQQVPQQHIPQQQVPQQQVPQQQVPQQQIPQHIPGNQYHHQPQQPVPVQNVPQAAHPTTNQQIPEGHNHGHHHGEPQVLNTANIAQEKEHIAEHLGVPMDTSKMSEQELQFHYFKMHDADNNNKLDGCELIKSLIHWHEEGNKDGVDKGQKIFTDEELISLIDPILEMDDTNKDGFIDYPEFIQAQQKAASATTHQ